MYRLVAWLQGVVVPALGPFGVFVLAFLDSSFLSLPEINDLLVVTAALHDPRNAWLPILMATLGSLAGCSVLWVLGQRGGRALLVRRFGNERTDRTHRAFVRGGALALAIPALLPPPMPFKVFVLAAGVFGYPFARFAATLLLARGLRYVVWAGLAVAYGPDALRWLHAADRWATTRLALVLSVAAGLFVILATMLLWRRRLRRGAGVGPAS